MGVVRYKIEKYVTYEKEIPEVLFKSGEREGQVRKPAYKEKRRHKVLDHYEYGIEDKDGHETATMRYRFRSLSLAWTFYAWQFHGGEMTDELYEWLQEVDRQETDRAKATIEEEMKEIC